MRKSITHLIILLTAILGVAIAFFLVKESKKKARLSKKQELRLILPSFDVLSNKDFSERLTKVNLQSLRTVMLPDDDFEVRVWVGFGLTGEDCFILRYFSGIWSAMHLQGSAQTPPFPNSLRTLSSPKSGWNKAWQRLIDAGILTLPDSSEVNCWPGVLDGISYVVEINKKMTYRSYIYTNPWYDKPSIYKRCNEAAQIILIGKIIGEEFGLERFDPSNI